jgi:hypothetical protein
MKLNIVFAGEAKNIPSFFAGLKKPTAVVSGASGSMFNIHETKFKSDGLDHGHIVFEKNPEDVRFFVSPISQKRCSALMKAGVLLENNDVRPASPNLANSAWTVGQIDQLVSQDVFNGKAALFEGQRPAKGRMFAVFKDPKFFEHLTNG